MQTLFQILLVLLLLIIGGFGLWIGYLYKELENTKEKLTKASTQNKEPQIVSEEPPLEEEAKEEDKLVPILSSEIKEPEIKITEYNELVNVLISLGDGLFVVDEERTIHFVNRAGERITEYSENEILGNHLWKILQIEDGGKRLGEGYCPVLDAMEKNITQMKYGAVLITKSGMELPISYTISPFISTNGLSTSKGASLLLRDITELRKVDRIRDEFITNVSHELRTPLTVIRGYSEILAEEFKDKMTSSQYDFLKMINDESERLAKLVDSILEFSKAQSGEIGLKKEQVDLLSLINDSFRIFSNFASKKEIQLRKNLPNDLSPIKGDKNALRFVIDHLIDNAIKFTPQGGSISIDLGGWKLEDGIWKVELSVTDTGIGIPKEHLPYIFERFYRVEQKVHTLQGTGIGLSMVKEIIELHGGNIVVESDVGKGTKFTIRLPMTI